MKPTPGMTHRPLAIDPAEFRALATGIGQAEDDIEATGRRRAQQVVNSTPMDKRKWLDDSYPAATMDDEGNYLPMDLLGVASPVPLKRAGK